MTHEITQWMMNTAGGDFTVEVFIEEMAEKLVAIGVPLERIAVFVQTPHPTVFGRRIMWHRETGVDVMIAPIEVRDKDIYINSPIYVVRKEARDIRKRLCDTEPAGDEFPVYPDLREEGVTDYFAMALPFMGGTTEIITFATKAPGGFTQEQTDMLEEIRMPLARIAEIFALKHTAGNLLSAYVGPGTGERIFNGQIHLGDGEKIEAVIAFCDLRRSSYLAESLGMEKFQLALNDFFSCTAGAIMENNGEILRFIGDAFLAIFPIQKCHGCVHTASNNAFNAVMQARQKLEELNQERVAAGEEVLKAGFGLHIGEVLYGNIGTPERLEFTVIGAAANEAARIEGMTQELQEPVIVSETFAKALDRKWKPLGAHQLRNVSTEIPLYGVA